MLATKESGEGPKGVMRVPLPTTAASDAASAPSASQPARPAAPASPWKVTLAALSVHAGELDWRDVTTTPNAALALTEFAFDAQSISWPVDAPVIFKGEGVIGTQTEHGKVTFSGQGNAAGATLQVALDALPLAAAGPYARAQLELPFAGTLSADLGVEWKPTPAGPQLKVDARRVALSGLVLGEAKVPEFGLEQIELLDAHVDTAARRASIGQVALHAPRLLLVRDKEGSWNFMHWHRTAAPSPEATAAHPLVASAAPVPASGVASGWKLALGDLTIDKARVAFADRSLDELVALNLSDFALHVHGWALDAGGTVPFRVSGQVAVPAGASGKAIGSGVVGSIDVRGEARGFSGGLPKSAKARLLLKDLPLHLVDPYLHAFVDIDVQKAQTSFKGDVAFEQRGNESGPRLRLRGEASIDDFIAASAPLEAPAAANEALAARQLLNWKLLSLRGIDVALVPGAPAHVAVAETSLTDFFARIVLDERGRLNLQDVARVPAAAQGAASAATAANAAPAAVAAAAPPSSPAGLAPLLEFGPIVLVNGRVNYTDHFVTPNYSADLSDLNGRLGAFTSRSLLPGAAPQLADIELRGRAQETGVLEITGKVNPHAHPQGHDLKAKVRDLELSPLSPYAIKYSGYGIERGKLSVDLAYLVKPDGELTASNRIVLNQLTFGEKVPGAKGSLPVKLAVALLADSHGVIDLDLPVSGSINDPQFSLGGVIWKAITNLIVKAVTAPFTLLASAFGGGSGDELSTVAFSPGRRNARRRGEDAPRPSRQGARRAADPRSYGERRKPPRCREGSLGARPPGADGPRREAPPRHRRRRQPERRSHGKRSRVFRSPEGGLRARRHRQAKERDRPDQGPADRRNGSAAPGQHRGARRRDGAARTAPRRHRARLPRDQGPAVEPSLPRCSEDQPRRGRLDAACRPQGLGRLTGGQRIDGSQTIGLSDGAGFWPAMAAAWARRCNRARSRPRWSLLK